MQKMKDMPYAQRMAVLDIYENLPRHVHKARWLKEHGIEKMSFYNFRTKMKSKAKEQEIDKMQKKKDITLLDMYESLPQKKQEAARARYEFKLGDKIKFTTSKGDIFGTLTAKTARRDNDSFYVRLDDKSDKIFREEIKYGYLVIKNYGYIYAFSAQSFRVELTGYQSELVTDEVPQQEEIPKEVLDLVRFMCQTWAEIDRFTRMNCDEDDLCLYPVIQGTRNQNNLREIGKQAYNAGDLKKAVNWMLKRD